MSRMTIQGDKQLIRAFGDVDRKVKRKIARAAVMKSTSVVSKATKRHMPVDTKTTRKAVGRKVKTYAKDGNVVGIVGVRRGFSAIVDGRKIVPVNIIHLIEEGFTHVGGTTVPGKHPIARAWDETKNTAARVTKDKVWDGIRAAAQVAPK